MVIVSEPVSPNEIAFERNRPLLILGRELQAADLRLDAVESIFALALRMQDVADPSFHHPAAAEGNDGVVHGNCRQVEVLPTTLTKQMTGKVVLVQALHDHDDGAVLLVVEARHQGAGIPVDHPLAGRLRHRLFGLERIVDDDEVGAAAGERAADRGGVAAAAGGRDELGAAIPCGPHGREQGPIPRRIDDHAELAMQFGGELVGVAHDDDTAGRIVTEQPCHIGDRHARSISASAAAG